MRQRIALIVSGWWVLAGLSGLVALTQAQTQTSEWAEPVNISQSGATANPFMIIDARGDFHVFWQDTYADVFMYSQGRESTWTPAMSVTLPFTGVTPLLLADENGRAHAFWFDSEEEFLLYSNAPITGLVSLDNWGPVQTLAETAADLDVTIDATGRLHLLYLWSGDMAEMPAGIYYRQTTDGGQNWSLPHPIYQSPYLRGLAREDANVELTTITSGGRSWVFAAWDNRSRKQIFLSRSGNGGLNWEEPLEVAGPESGSSVVLPFDIRMGGKDDNLILLWSNGQPGVSCRQFWQSSDDLGQTWGERQPMVELLPGLGTCVRDSQFMVGADDVFLLSTIEGQVYLWAWDGRHWSDPQLQTPLTSFDNRETLNSVSFQCRQPAVTPDDRLAVVGCDSRAGSFNDGDIWLLSRSLGSVADWFPPLTAWSPVVAVSNGPDPYYTQTVVDDDAGNFLAFWVMADASGAATRHIYVSRLAEGRWSLPEQIINSPEPMVGALTAVVGPSGELYLSWGGDSGQLYLVRNTVAEAHIASTWTRPMALTAVAGVASFPTLVLDEAHVLYLVYTIAVNEGRGAYLLRSTDNGRTWDEPTMIFDGVAAEWEVVGPARLAVMGDGQLHLLLSQQSLLGGNGPQTQALHYIRSEDGGQTFTPATLVAEGEFIWSALAATDTQTVHQLWQAWNGADVALQHSYSVDGGQTWSRALTVDAIAGPVALTGDDAGQLFLLNLADTAVNEWHWKNNGWVPQEGFDLGQLEPVHVAGRQISASVMPEGWLVSLFTAQSQDEASGETQFSLQAASRAITESVSIDVVDVVTTTVDSVIVTPVVTISSTQTQEPTTTPLPGLEATAVPATPAIPSDNGSPPVSPVSGLLFGLIPLLLLILIIFVIGLYTVRLRRR